MFGYITIDKMELKFKEYYRYRGYYCGLCKTLKRNYGEISRFTLNYDMTFLVLLLTSLYEPVSTIGNERCYVHPTKKQMIISNEIMDYVAAINVILAYHKLMDDWKDEKSIKSLSGMGLLKRQYNKAKSDYEVLDQLIQSRLEELHKLEKKEEDNIDLVSNIFASIMSKIFVYKEDIWQPYLEKIGFAFGKLVYLLDAVDDLEEDQKKERYNPLKYNNHISKDELYDLLLFELSIVDEEMDKLPLIMDKSIIDNIFYSGIMKRINACLKREQMAVNEEELNDYVESKTLI
ncbi:DUF5685 family protein [Vallitalea okinawensis]|uniref:DUF5685 family protein n=1 Tax=Vallitalea okinawensis TaxID=2078660 RepID=UPI000CFAD5BE|nr:DUF5685 family protein [Vallitalea okinawensis]